MDNNNRKIIGFDPNTGFPIYEGDQSENIISYNSELTEEEKNKRYKRYIIIALIPILIILCFAILELYTLLNADTGEYGVVGALFFPWFLCEIFILPLSVLSISMAKIARRIKKNWLSFFIIILAIAANWPLFILILGPVLTIFE